MTKRAPPGPPRFTRNAEQDTNAIRQWINDFYQSGVNDTRLLDPKRQFVADTFDADSLFDPTDSSIANAQLTANEAYNKGITDFDALDSAKAPKADPTFTGDTTISNALFLTGLLTYSISSNQDNYSPTGIDLVSVLGVTPTGADRTITGIATGATGRVLTILNQSDTYNLLLAHDTTSTAANRFYLNNNAGSDLRIQPHGAVILYYDPGISRWKVIAAYGTSGEYWFESAGTFAVNNLLNLSNNIDASGSIDIDVLFPGLIPVTAKSVSLTIETGYLTAPVPNPSIVSLRVMPDGYNLGAVLDRAKVQQVYANGQIDVVANTVTMPVREGAHKFFYALQSTNPATADKMAIIDLWGYTI